MLQIGPNSRLKIGLNSIRKNRQNSLFPSFHHINFLMFNQKPPQICKAIIFVISESACKSDKHYLVVPNAGCDLPKTNLEVSI